jgi:hypothetical protein
MVRKQYTEEQFSALRESEVGAKVMDLCRYCKE